MDDIRSSGRPRLNPLAFPAETNIRFALFMVAAVMLACNLSVFLNYIVLPEQSITLAEPLELPSLDTPTDEFVAQIQTELFKLIEAALRGLLFPVGLFLIMAIAAVVIYRTHPTRIRRHKGLVPLAPDKDQRFMQEIQQMAQRTGISPVPTVELGKGLKSQNGQTFGLRSNYILRLDGGLRLLLRKAPDIFRAVVLHELAHIANRDIGRTYFTRALWTAVIIVALVPLVLGLGYLFFDSVILRPLLKGFDSLDLRQLVLIKLPVVFMFDLQVGATLAIIYLIQASILRVRETYADWRAALWGAEQGLTRILTMNITKEQRAKEKDNMWRLHPSARRRLDQLQNPAGLFQLSWDLPFIVGLLLAFVWSGTVIVVLPLAVSLGSGLLALGGSLTYLADQNDSVFLIYLAYFSLWLMTIVTILALVVPVLGLGYLIAGTVGLQVQRQAVADLVASPQGCGGYMRLLISAALIALGLEAGFLMAPLALFSPLGAIMGQTANDLLLLFLIFPWLLTATGLMWACLIYLRYFARQLLGFHIGPKPPTRQRIFLTLAASGLFWLMILPLVAGRFAIIYNFEATTQQFLINAAGFTLVLALILYTIIFGGTWLIIRLWRLAHRRRCPTCQHILAANLTAVDTCEQCHQILSPWLLIEQDRIHI